MTPERWRQVTEVFHAALARRAPARGRYLDDTCADDPALRAEVDAMLAAHAESAAPGAVSLNVPRHVNAAARTWHNDRPASRVTNIERHHLAQ